MVIAIRLLPLSVGQLKGEEQVLHCSSQSGSGFNSTLAFSHTYLTDYGRNDALRLLIPVLRGPAAPARLS